MRARLTLLQVMALLLGLVGVAAGGGGVWATQRYTQELSERVEGAALRLSTATVTISASLGDIDSVFDLVPQIRSTLDRTTDLLIEAGVALEHLRQAIERLAPAMGLMAEDLRTLGRTLGTLARGTHLEHTAEGLDRAGEQLAASLAPMAAMTGDLNQTGGVVGAFAERLRGLEEHLQLDTSGLQDAVLRLGAAGQSLGSGPIRPAIAGVGYGLSGLLLFIGLSLLVMAGTLGALRRTQA